MILRVLEKPYYYGKAAAVADVPVDIGPGLTVERVEAAQLERFAREVAPLL